MAGKILCFQDGTTPTVPPPNQWRKAPFLETDQDHFWNLVGVEQEDVIVPDDPKFLEDEGPIDGALISPSSIPRLLVERGDFPYSFIEFDGHTGCPTNWKLWARHVLSTEAYRNILERSNILDAMRLFSDLSIRRDNLSLLTLISRWSTDSHTFVASWGEFSPTLEDVVVLYRLPILSDNGVNWIDLAPEDQTVVDDLKQCAIIASKKGSWFDGSTLLRSQPVLGHKKLTYASWVCHFFKDVPDQPSQDLRCVNGPEFDTPLHLAGFLSYWLDRFIFEGRPEDGLNTRVFPLAAILARGCAVSLAPMFLGTLYHRLDMIKEDLSRSLGRYDISSFISCPFLMMFLFERFPSYSASPPKEFVANDADGAPVDNGRALRWSGITGRKLGDLIDYEREFVFRPYALHINGIEFPMFYFDKDEQLGLVQTMNHSQLIFAVMTVGCCLPSFTEAGMSSASYKPARVSRQFGFDQGVPSLQGNGSSFHDCLRKLSDRSYSRTFFIPSYDRHGRCSVSYREFWKKNLDLFLSFHKESPLPIVPPYIFVGNSSLKLPKEQPSSSRGNATRFVEEFARTCSKKLTATERLARIPRSIGARNSSMPSAAADSPTILRSKRVLCRPTSKRPRKDSVTSARATSSSNFVEIGEDPITTSSNAVEGNKGQAAMRACAEDSAISARATSSSNFVEIGEDPITTSNNAVEGNKEQAGIPARAEDGATCMGATSRNFVENVEDPITTGNNAAEGNIEQVTTSNNAAEGNIEQASYLFFWEDIEQASIPECAEVSMPMHAEAIMPEQTRAPERTSTPGSLRTLERATTLDLDDFFCWADQNLVALTGEDTHLNSTHTRKKRKRERRKKRTQPTEGQSLGANPKGSGNFKTRAEGFGVIATHNQPSNIQQYIQNFGTRPHPIFLRDREVSRSRSFPIVPRRISEFSVTAPHHMLLTGIEFSQSSNSFPALSWRIPEFSVTDESRSIVNSVETMRRLNRSTDDALSPVPAENIDLSMTLGSGVFPKAPLALADSGQTSTDRLVLWNQFFCSSNKVDTLERIYQRHLETFADFKVQGPEFQSVYLDMLADVIKLLEEKLVRDIDDGDISKVNQLLNNGKLVGLNLSWLEFRVRAIENLASDKRQNGSVLCQIRQCEEEIIELERKKESLKSSSLDLEQKILAQQERFGDSLNWDGFSLDGLI